jgi:nucleoporin NDC1
MSTLMALITPFIYQFFLRRTAWSYKLYFAKLFWNFTRAAAEPPKRFLPITFSMMVRSAISGGALVLLWQTTNLFFSTFISKEPLKRGQPLTTETKDPTGSLLDGLKAKKEVVKTFALWELCLISQRLPDRRKAIFDDIDRTGGPAWTQILNASTNIINGINTRINAYKKPPSSTQAQTAQSPIQTLPRLTKPPKEDNIFAPSPKPRSRQEKLEEAFRATAKSYGQAPDWTPIARAKARDVLGRASTLVLSPDRKQKLLGAAQELKLLTGPSKSQPSSLVTTFPFLLRVLRSPLGKPFRQTYARRLCAIVLGTPYGELSPIADAIESLTRLLVASLTEDTFGKVQADVPGVVRLFTQTIIALQNFVNGGLNIHWTDVDFPPASDPDAQSRARRVPEVEIVLKALKTSLAELLAAFRLYLGEVGLAGKDLRLARQAAGVDDQHSSTSAS